MPIRRERIREIKCKSTPSHQSDLYDTLMCRFEPLAGKEMIVHGDHHYADYHYDYEKGKKEPLTIINDFKLDIKPILEQYRGVEAFRNKVLFNLPHDIINTGTPERVDFGTFPLFVCEFDTKDITIGKQVDINCFSDYNNMMKDFKVYKKEFPGLVKYI